jgi:hypothetical protein
VAGGIPSGIGRESLLTLSSLPGQLFFKAQHGPGSCHRWTHVALVADRLGLPISHCSSPSTVRGRRHTLWNDSVRMPRQGMPRGSVIARDVKVSGHACWPDKKGEFSLSLVEESRNLTWRVAAPIALAMTLTSPKRDGCNLVRLCSRAGCLY